MNMRGKTQTEIFGTMTLDQYNQHILQYAKELDISVEIFHSNIEGEVINRLYAANDEGFDGALVNPAGFSRGLSGTDRGDQPNQFPGDRGAYLEPGAPVARFPTPRRSAWGWSPALACLAITWPCAGCATPASDASGAIPTEASLRSGESAHKHKGR